MTRRLDNLASRIWGRRRGRRGARRVAMRVAMTLGSCYGRRGGWRRPALGCCIPRASIVYTVKWSEIFYSIMFIIPILDCKM